MSTVKDNWLRWLGLLVDGETALGPILNGDKGVYESGEYSLPMVMNGEMDHVLMLMVNMGNLMV